MLTPARAFLLRTACEDLLVALVVALGVTVGQILLGIGPSAWGTAAIAATVAAAFLVSRQRSGGRP